MTTLDPTSWTKLCESQMQRALAGDAQAAKWCADHRPDVTAPPDCGEKTMAEIQSMPTDELRAHVVRRFSALGLLPATCPECGCGLKLEAKATA